MTRTQQRILGNLSRDLDRAIRWGQIALVVAAGVAGLGCTGLIKLIF